MLIQFNFKNYKSFKEEATLDMSATQITEFNHHVISIEKERILPIAAIFGANASGKSNVFEAFKYMARYVIHSFSYGDAVDESSEKSAFSPPKPFLFNKDSANQESTFEIYFTDKANTGKIYNYGFSVNGEGVTEEWLNYKPKSSRGVYKRIFYRNTEELDLSGITKNYRENIKTSLNKETLVVSLGAKLKNETLKEIRDWFLKCEFVNFGDPVENILLSTLTPSNFAKDKETQNNVIKYFSTFDPSIVGFDVEELEYEEGNGRKKIRISTIHKISGTNETVSIPLKEESAGTLKMFSLYPMLQKC